MTSHRPETQRRRPLPQRPVFGFSAWQLVVRYINLQHSPDALLKLEVYPAADGHILWSASVSWGVVKEIVRDMDSLGNALSELWHEVVHHHPIFLKSEDAFTQPSGYGQMEWIDENTQSLFDRILSVTQDTFEDDWLWIIIYQPAQTQNMRVQMRLLANSNAIRIGGRGENLLNAGHNLFNNATQYFISNTILSPIMRRNRQCGEFG